MINEYIYKPLSAYVSLCLLLAKLLLAMCVGFGSLGLMTSVLVLIMTQSLLQCSF